MGGAHIFGSCVGLAESVCVSHVCVSNVCVPHLCVLHVCVLHCAFTSVRSHRQDKVLLLMQRVGETQRLAAMNVRSNDSKKKGSGKRIWDEEEVRLRDSSSKPRAPVSPFPVLVAGGGPVFPFWPPEAAPFSRFGSGRQRRPRFPFLAAGGGPVFQFWLPEAALFSCFWSALGRSAVLPVSGLSGHSAGLLKLDSPLTLYTTGYSTMPLFLTLYE